MNNRTCVIGWPVEHSRSPLIHNYWLRTHDIKGEYVTRAVQPQDLDSFVRAFTEEGYVGYNVTVPHKENVAKLVKAADESTRRLGAVNTVFLKAGEAFGTNTDGQGFIANLRDAAPNFVIRDALALILGAGGAARAVVGALLDNGIGKVVIANRTEARARELCALFGKKPFSVSWTSRSSALRNVDLLVNTTLLGMKGQAKLELPLDQLPAHAVVSDLVYVPVETDLIAGARLRGHQIADGLGMLLHQARPAFERWYGVKPAVTTELRRLVENNIR